MQKDQDIPHSSLNLNRELSLQSFFDSTPMMMGIVEVVDGDIRHVADNEAANRFFGREANEVSGRLTSELGVPGDIMTFWIENYLEAENTGKPVILSISILHRIYL